jgi:2-polyprenyl-3-methyl-5-hydroxy-6-metoxy-1,4-benzoquinol methylase
MEKTGEREIPSKPGTIEGIDSKHIKRYVWAASYAHGKRVYDIACGTGYGSLLLEASDYTGFDSSIETIEYAGANYRKGKTVKFSVADACKMPESMETADVIVSFETIEHIKEPEAFLKWCGAHGKMLLISSPIQGTCGHSRWHLFEYQLDKFEEILKKYFAKVNVFLQRDNGEIIYPCPPGSRGVAVAVCQN